MVKNPYTVPLSHSSQSIVHQDVANNAELMRVITDTNHGEAFCEDAQGFLCIVPYLKIHSDTKILIVVNFKHNLLLNLCSCNTITTTLPTAYRYVCRCTHKQSAYLKSEHLHNKLNTLVLNYSVA